MFVIVPYPTHPLDFKSIKRFLLEERSKQNLRYETEIKNYFFFYSLIFLCIKENVCVKTTDDFSIRIKNTIFIEGKGLTKL